MQPSTGRPIVLVAMGGHAFMQRGERGTIEDHERNAEQIAKILMSLVERDYHLVVTHEKEVVGIISSFDLLKLVEDKRFVAKAGPTPSKRKSSRKS